MQSNMDQFVIEEQPGEEREQPGEEKLRSLVTVLENDLRKLYGNTIEVEKILQGIADEAGRSAEPRQEQVSLLYCHLAEENKAQQVKLQGQLREDKRPVQCGDYEQEEEDTVSLTGEIPFFLYSGTAKQIVGREAFKKNVFYSRLITAVCSFVAFVVMCCVPRIGWRYVDPNYFLEYIIALCAIIFLHSTLWIMYYILPVDTADRKYVPGMRNLFDSCLNPSDVTSYGQRMGSFFNLYSKSLEPILDGGFLAMLGLASILASMNLEHGVAFYNAFEADALSVYFSIMTFMQTFENTDGCLNGNPVGLIQASLTLSFLAVFALAFTFQVTFRSFLLERKKQILIGGGNSSLASQQLTDESDDRTNTRQPYESSTASPLTSSDSKKYVRV